MEVTESSETFRDITVIKVLDKAKFPVYMVQSKVNKQNYAMKVFPHANNKPHPSFKRESRFPFGNHPYILKTHHIEAERETLSKGVTKKVSYKIMDLTLDCNLFDFLMDQGKDIDDKLMRTYFRHLIDGLEYLHSTGVSHMDLKLENLLLGTDFFLKITNFDQSHFATDTEISSRGTKFYRSPEVIQGRCENSQAADIYSAGIILFTFMTRGMLPHGEDTRVGGVDFFGLLYTQNDEFWNKHCEIQKKDNFFFNQDFKDLFNAMIALNPEDRATTQQVKQSAWCNGPVYTSEELQTKVGRIFGF